MILCIADILTPTEILMIQQRLQDAAFGEGKETAGWIAKQVKHNQQLSTTSPVWEELQSQILPKVQQHPLIQIAAYPNIIHPLRISRYDSGMYYGIHTDNALMPTPTRGMMRSDISLTLFLSDPFSYQGGELIIETSWGEQTYKLPAGALVLYPSDFLHQVAPVVSGTRLVAVTWIQSWVRDPRQREILFDLQTLRQELLTGDGLDENGGTSSLHRLSKIHSNLLRQWAEP